MKTNDDIIRRVYLLKKCVNHNGNTRKEHEIYIEALEWVLE